MGIPGHFLNNSEFDDNDSHWLPVGDLMAGLMFLFILALAAYMLNITTVVEDITESNKLRAELLQEIKQEMENQGFTQLNIYVNQGVMRLEQGVLFNTGEAELLEEGKEILSVLGNVMYIVLSKPKYNGEVNTIFIEGHTDSDPIVFANDFQSNWDLSAYRAINTWRYLRDTEIRLNSLTNDIGESIFSISGYADSRPVAPNDTEVGKRNNRRIDFRINMKPPPSQSSESISNEIQAGM